MLPSKPNEASTGGLRAQGGGGGGGGGYSKPWRCVAPISRDKQQHPFGWCSIPCYTPTTPASCWHFASHSPLSSPPLPWHPRVHAPPQPQDAHATPNPAAKAMQRTSTGRGRQGRQTTPADRMDGATNTILLMTRFFTKRNRGEKKESRGQHKRADGKRAGSTTTKQQKPAISHTPRTTNRDGKPCNSTPGSQTRKDETAFLVPRLATGYFQETLGKLPTRVRAMTGRDTPPP